MSRVLLVNRAQKRIHTTYTHTYMNKNDDDPIFSRFAATAATGHYQVYHSSSSLTHPHAHTHTHTTY